MKIKELIKALQEYENLDAEICIDNSANEYEPSNLISMYLIKNSVVDKKQSKYSILLTDVNSNWCYSNLMITKCIYSSET